ncbi:MAG TPA: hypothetical protein DCZ08_10960, partial [Anaerolineaceae bacterium]|nr:hypothetical protein [Anaerolineaceae bacterium]
MVLLSVLAILALFLGGCTTWLEPLLNGEPAGVVTPTSAPTAEVNPGEPTMSPEPVAPIQGAVTIPIWLPPQFDPEGDTPAGDVLRARLDAFMEENPGVLLVTRVKAASGPG